MLFRSKEPDVDFPRHLSVWEWLFEDYGYSSLYKVAPDAVGGFTNAVTNERLTFAHVKEHASHLSTALVKAFGLCEGDSVSLFSQNTVWYPVAMYAVLRAGGMVNGASPAYGVDEMTHALKTAKSKYLLTVPSSIGIASIAAERAGIPKKHIFLLEGELQGYTAMEELLNIGKGFKHNQASVYRIPPGKTNSQICGFLNFSSGTTGLPKAVMLSHANAIAQCHQLKQIEWPGTKKFVAQIPLFHISGLVRFLTWPAFNNDECVMMPQFTMDLFLKTIVEHQITDVTLVPPIVIRLVQDPIVDQYDLSCVKRVASSSAPLTEELIQKLQKKLPWTGFRQSYGMTESCGCISTHTPEFYSYKYANTSGTLCGSTTVKIVDAVSGVELEQNQVGEILAKGPQVAMGYLDNLQATAETFDSDGFLHSGDLGKIDDAGFVHIVGRIKELIKVKGQQVAPAELDDLLLRHPDVADCAVLGIPDDYSGERPKAFVVVKAGKQASQALGQDLLCYVQQNRVKYKWLKELEFVDVIPKNPSGKILRRMLANRPQGTTPGLVIKEQRERARI